MEAFTFALLNVGVSFLIGAVGVRELNHRNYFRKLLGLISLVCYLALALGLNLVLAHYREVAGSLVSDAGREVLIRLRTTPLAVTDFKSWLFFGLGLRHAVHRLCRCVPDLRSVSRLRRLGETAEDGA